MSPSPSRSDATKLAARRIDHLTWTSDSRYLYCDPELVIPWARRIRVADGHVEALVDLSEQGIAHSGAGLALDGRPLFLRGASDIFALELERR